MFPDPQEAEAGVPTEDVFTSPRGRRSLAADGTKRAGQPGSDARAARTSRSARGLHGDFQAGAAAGDGAQVALDAARHAQRLRPDATSTIFWRAPSAPVGTPREVLDAGRSIGHRKVPRGDEQGRLPTTRGQRFACSRAIRRRPGRASGNSCREGPTPWQRAKIHRRIAAWRPNGATSTGRKRSVTAEDH